MDKLRTGNGFKKKMESLDIYNGDIVYIESKFFSDTFKLTDINRLLHNLIDYLGDEGTIVMSLSGFNKHINEEVALDFRALKYLLPYQERTQGVYSESKLAGYLSLMKDSKVSKSSFYPFVAVGKYADLIVNGQSFDFPNGCNSPFSRLYEFRAKALLINHDIKSFLLNEHIFDISYNTVVRVNGGVFGDSYKSYLDKKVDVDIMQRIFNSDKYKKLFYFAKANEMPILGLDIRDYVDYCRSYIEEQV